MRTLPAAVRPDYELTSHTRGGSIQFQDQINAQNLVSLSEDYTTANSVRDNNSFYAVGPAAVVVNAAAPDERVLLRSDRRRADQLPTATSPRSVRSSPASSGTTGGVRCRRRVRIRHVATTQCAYMLAENGNHATYNQVVPQFWASSLTDEFRPTDKWLFNLGIRLDSFTFNGSNTNYRCGPRHRGPTRSTSTTASTTSRVRSFPRRGAVTAACPTGQSPAFFQNVPANFTYNIWQPRISGTYTVNPTNVVRFSYGRYTQAPNSAFEQYNTQQEDLADYIGGNFYAFGRTTPGYPIAPPTSINYDLSWEHQFRGTDMSFKLTPFLRQTQNQIQQFFLDQKTGFVSGLNVGSQRSQGLEFLFQKGDFSKNGFAGQLSFAYTDSYIKYGTLASGEFGTTVITGTNQVISQYNAYTKACAPGGAYVGKTGFNHVPLCGTTNATGSAVARRRATPRPALRLRPAVRLPTSATRTGTARKAQIDPNSQFPTYSIFPGGVGSSAAAYGAPYVATLLVNYKHDKFAITPSLQFAGGSKYGAPQSNPGIDPAACTAVLPGVAGFNGGGRYDAQSCGAADGDSGYVYRQLRRPRCVHATEQHCDEHAAQLRCEPACPTRWHAREHLQYLLGRHHGTLDVRQRQRLRLQRRAVSGARSSRSATSTTPPAITDRSFNRS